MLLRALLIIAAVLPPAIAQLKVTVPAPGGTTPVTALTITWTNDATAKTQLSALGKYTVFLMIGGGQDDNVHSKSIGPSAAGTHTATGGTIAIAGLDASLGPSASNAYYLKFVSEPLAGTGTVINYSQRFSISGMTGTKWPSPEVEQAAKGVAVDAVPATQDTVAAGGPPAGGPPGHESYTVPYPMQTGPVKYAPMQPKPPSSISATKTDPLNPTSAWTVATTFLSWPTVYGISTTSTEAVNYVASTSRENKATKAPMPKNDMQKFLARWRD